ncbi:unnamed protein product [Linum trigynum]|uniref:ATP-dependent DNA helicase n=1 Tax=Linum trigynum TaxID=586398 RepID=A0AAV2CBE5_9ROSI
MEREERPVPHHLSLPKRKNKAITSAQTGESKPPPKRRKTGIDRRSKKLATASFNPFRQPFSTDINTNNTASTIVGINQSKFQSEVEETTEHTSQTPTHAQQEQNLADIQQPQETNTILQSFDNNILDLGLPTLACTNCGARFWPQEQLNCNRPTKTPIYTLCCQQGRIRLPLLKPTPPLLDKLLDVSGDSTATHFGKHRRQYNAAFSFTSMGAKVDQRLLNSRGPYSMVICGENYHLIGSLLPPNGERPKFAQLYLFDPSTEVEDRMANFSSNDEVLKAEIVSGLIEMFNETNELVKSFRRVREHLQNPENQNLRLRIVGTRVKNGEQYELPTGQELAGLIPGDFRPDNNDRDIIVLHRSQGLWRINSLNPKFDALHFPLLFPYGEDGFHTGICYNEPANRRSRKRMCITQREYYSFRLQHRDNEGSTLMRGGKVLQHYIIDAFSTIEQNRLIFLRQNQEQLRSEIFQGLYDAYKAGKETGKDLGRIILPASYTGGPRYMKNLYLDAMAICQQFGNPDLFITFTCNAQWPEIVHAFEETVGNRSENKTQIVARVFRMKLRALKERITKQKYFGKTVADLYTVEFQKRGLPHVHILIWLDEPDKLKDIAAIDSVISSDIPDRSIDREGYEAVTRFMMHGPCGQSNTSAPCMVDGRCSKHFPKAFSSETTYYQFGYIVYRRRDTGIHVEKGRTKLDNRFVVPYNRDLLVWLQAHINVEICHKGRLIKYLFKYLTKGHDRSMVEATNRASSSSNEQGPIDEISQYLDCRYLSAYEAAWRIYEFPIHERTPAVLRMCVHLPNQQTVPYNEDEPLENVVQRRGVNQTMLTQWFKLNRTNPAARTLTYREIPNKFVWDQKQADWFPRKRGFQIGRIVSVPPGSDAVYLRMLLTKIRGALSFEHLRTVDGICYRTYKKACNKLGLLSTDEEWKLVLEEVCQWGQPSLIRTTFTSLLMFCEITEPLSLFEKFWEQMADDIVYRARRNNSCRYFVPPSRSLQNSVLLELQRLLNYYSTTLQNVGLPTPQLDDCDVLDNSLIAEQLDYDITEQRRRADTSWESLNENQRYAYDAVFDSASNEKGSLFFLYGHGGTGKTFLYDTLIAKLRSMKKIVLVVASSGIAATLLPDAITAHSRFKIPLEIDRTSTCMIKKGSHLAQLIKEASLIVWDEAPMTHRFSFEAVDRTFCDIMNCPLTGDGYKPFGGKCVLLGGDFRQTLPVVVEGGREESIDSSLTRSHLWKHFKVLPLTVNMRINTNHNNLLPIYDGMDFASWVLAVGDGRIKRTTFSSSVYTDWIKIPDKFLIPHIGNKIQAITETVYTDFRSNYGNPDYIKNRAIVTPTNRTVSEINAYMLAQIKGRDKIYYSSDSIEDDSPNSIRLEEEYPTEFLNGLSFNGVPEHEIHLKVSTPVILLRNLNPAIGLCNGTRIMITHLGDNVIRGDIIGGKYDKKTVAIPRIVLNVTEHRWPFVLKRRQFPVRVCYAMTINKSQGQTLDIVGVYLPKPVFSHGQLYVAVSRVRSADGLHILIDNDAGVPQSFTRNIVYEETFADINGTTQPPTGERDFD